MMTPPAEQTWKTRGNTMRTPLLRNSSLFVALAVNAVTMRPATAQPRPQPADTTGYVNVDDERLYFEIHGERSAGAVPLVILHGAFMSSGEMAELARAFSSSRPVVVIDQRAHGRSTGVNSALSYPRLGDDAAAVVSALGFETADVLGYSMGGGAALQMAIRHPQRVHRLVILSATYRRDGWYDEVLESIAALSAEQLAATPMGAEYRRLSPTPDAFPAYFESVMALNYREQDLSDEQVRAIAAPTMIIVGDADGVRLEHAVDFFRLRGGGDTEAAAKGMTTAIPRARLLILPAASHLGLLAMVPQIGTHVEDFLTDAAPKLPAAYRGSQ
jgi:pimeloyl-ACP methyl ester carboxylesterase